MAEATDVAIIGAGPAGLAVGACLRRVGVDFIILEKEGQLAPSWRGHYDRLRLHTVKAFSSLPYLAFPKAYPRYVPRDLMIEYLETYAARFGLQPRLNDAVRSVRRDETGWLIESERSAIRADFAVIASGHNAEASIPSVPGIESFNGCLLHSASYVNAKSFTGQSVLVVGMGNTGAEIALDLAEGGGEPTISVRNGVHIVPRELFGVPIQIVAMLATGVLPRKASDILFPPVIGLALGNLSRYGLARPQEGILQRIENAAKIPVIDIGTVQKISAGEIKIAPGISEAWEEGVIFRDGKKSRFDAIILATGYHPNYRNYLEWGGDREEARERGLFFVGYRNAATGLLHEISKEAKRVAGSIAAGR
jgi:Flavin-binding monooxygenase-like